MRNKLKYLFIEFLKIIEKLLYSFAEFFSNDKSPSFIIEGVNSEEKTEPKEIKNILFRADEEKNYYYISILDLIGILIKYTFLIWILLLSYEIFNWIKYGNAGGITLSVLLEYLFNDNKFLNWLESPKNWIGLHKLFGWYFTARISFSFFFLTLFLSFIYAVLLLNPPDKK